MKPGRGDHRHKLLISGDELRELKRHSGSMAEAFGLDRKIENYQGTRPITLYRWDLDCLLDVIDRALMDERDYPDKFAPEYRALARLGERLHQEYASVYGDDEMPPLGKVRAKSLSASHDQPVTVPGESSRLKLGKGQSFFVKRELRWLRQEDDTWEADFFPIPCSDGSHETVWMGMVLSHAHEYVLAQTAVEKPPSVNDLARLLAEAMRRPLVELAHRPRTLYLREKSAWAELLPHLKQVGIQVVSQAALPNWDRAFGDLHAQVEQSRSKQAFAPRNGGHPGEEEETMQENTDNQEAAFRELVRVLEGAVQAGADSVGMEYEDRDLIVFYNFGNTGLGAARIPRELQQAVIQELVERAGLSRKSRGTMQVRLLGKDYEVKVEEYDSFGESAFNLKLKEAKKKAARLKLLAPAKPTRPKAPDAPEQPSDPRKVRIYTLAVFLPRMPINKTFAKKKSGVSRTIQMRGDQTLLDLHHAIFHAFDRDDEHLYEFQLGRGARDAQGPIYVLEDYGANNVAGFVTETTIDSLRLKAGRSFGYLFDFGDNWQHQINVEAVEEAVPQRGYPKVIKQVGKSPSQYGEEDE